MENEGSEDTHPVTSWGHAEEGPGFDNERRNSACNRPTIIWEPLFAKPFGPREKYVLTWRQTACYSQYSLY